MQRLKCFLDCCFSHKLTWYASCVVSQEIHILSPAPQRVNRSQMSRSTDKLGRAQQGTAAERSHLRRSATGGGVIQSTVVQPFTPSAWAVTAVPSVGRAKALCICMMSNDSWYVAVLVVRSALLADAQFEPLIDLQYKLIAAPNPDAAYSKALQLGENAKHSYQNEDGETVTWECVGLADLQEMDEPPGDGVEVFYRLELRDPSEIVVTKEELTVFCSERNKEKTARDLLDPQ